MPLCKTKMEETTVEDLAELSEIENHNLGQVCVYMNIGCYEQCEATSNCKWESNSVFFLPPPVNRCRLVVCVPPQT